VLVAAALLTRSVLAASRADLGFPTRGLAIVSVDPEMARYDDARTRQFFERAVERVAGVPGVTSVATATRLPLSLNFSDDQFEIPGHASPGDRGFTLLYAAVSPGYFGTLDIPLKQGRLFTDFDTGDTARVAVVSEAMVRRFWPNGGAVGRTIRSKRPGSRPIEIVGVVADHRVRTVGEDPESYVYVPLRQRWNPAQIIVARTSGDAGTLLRAMERELLALEPNIVLLDRQTMDQQVSAVLLPLQAGMTVAAAGGLIALGLAALGLYGVVAYSVARRTREMGVRMALGANRSRVVALVLRQGLGLALAGLVAGALVAAAAMQVLGGMLYGVGAGDPLAWTAAAGLLLAVTTLANFLPAYRASRIDPAVALRTG
jgi:predicted permease